MNHPAVDLALELVRNKLAKEKLPVPPWLGAVVMGPRVLPGQPQRMPQTQTIGPGLLSRVHLTGGSWVGLSHTAAQGPLRDFTLADSILDHHLMWTENSYEIQQNVVWDHVLVADVWKEHGCYFRPVAAALGPDGKPDLKTPCRVWRECAYVGIGGQSEQSALRGWEVAGYESMGEGGPLIHEGGIVSNAGRNRDPISTRASFCISHHARQWNKPGQPGGFPAPAVEPYQHDVIVRRRVIDLSMQGSSRGAFLAEGRRRLVRYEECLVLCSTLEQPMAKVADADRLELAGCILWAGGANGPGQAWIQADRVGALVTTGCVGPIGVHRDGIDDGAVTKERVA